MSSEASTSGKANDITSSATAARKHAMFIDAGMSENQAKKIILEELT